MPIAHFVRISFACVAIPNKNKTYKMGYGFADFIATQKTKQRLKLWLAGWNYGVTKRKTNKLALIASP